MGRQKSGSLKKRKQDIKRSSIDERLRGGGKKKEFEGFFRVEKGKHVSAHPVFFGLRNREKRKKGVHLPCAEGGIRIRESLFCIRKNGEVFFRLSTDPARPSEKQHPRSKKSDAWSKHNFLPRKGKEPRPLLLGIITG